MRSVIYYGLAGGFDGMGNSDVDINLGRVDRGGLLGGGELDLQSCCFCGGSV